VRVLVVVAAAFGHAVRLVHTYGLAFGSAAIVAVGAAELTHRRSVGLVVAGVFGLAYDHRRSV
jgi:hypothetical protein